MDWKKLGKDVVAAGAPILGGILAGPGGAGLGAMVASLFGADPTDPQDIAIKMAGDPEAHIKLRKLELDNKAELEKLFLADIQSARQREVEVTRATGKTNWPMYILAGAVVIGFFTLMFVLMKYTVPQGSREVAFMLFGSLSTSFGAVVNYFFGSSKGSADKNLMLQKKG